MIKRILATALLGLVAASQAQAQTIKYYPQFTSAGALSGSNLFAISKGGNELFKSDLTTLSAFVLNSGGLGGDCTITALSINCLKTNGVNFGTFATQSFASPPIIGATTPNVGHFSTLSATGLLSTAASGTGSAGLNLPQGAAPTSPNNGDIWVTTAGMFVRANGTTVGPLSAGGGGGGVTIGAAITGSCTNGYNLYNTGGVIGCQPNGGGGGTVTTSGSPSSGNLTKFSGPTAITNGDLSGAVSTSGTLVTTLGTNAVATSNITNANVTLAKIANAAASSKLLGSGASGSGSPYAELTLGPTLGITGTTVGLAGTVVAGTTQLTTATQWNAGTSFVVTTGAQTLTLPVSSTLSANGGIAIQTIGQSVTLAPNAADAINGGTAGVSQVISAGLTAYVTTDGAGNIHVSPTSAAGSGTVTSVTCGTGLSGGTITSTGTCTLDLTHVNTWTGQQIFLSVLGTENAQTGTTYTLAATDCGKTVSFSNGSAVTVTIPASIVPSSGTTCNIIIRQDGAGQVAVTGTAVSAATLVTHVASSAATKTAGQHAVIGLQLSTISAVATATLTGDGA